MQMRKYLCCLAAALAFSCARTPIKIGFIGPLTGPSSAVGLGARNGFLMALGEGEGRAKGKVGRLTLVVEDDENDPDRCGEVMKEFKATGCGLVVLATTSYAAKDAIPWAMAEGVLVISPTVSNAEFSGKDDLFIRVNTSSDIYGAFLAETAAGRYAKKVVGLLGDSRNESYVSAVLNSFRERFTRLGGKLGFEMRFSSDKEIPEGELLDELRRTASEGLVLIGASTEVVIIAKFLEKAKLPIQLFLPPWPLTLDLIRNGGSAVEGVAAVSIADMEYRSEAGKAFQNAYLSEFGEAPSFTAMFGYEAAAILRKTLAGGGKTDPDSVKGEILKIRNFDGLQGPISFDDSGDATRAMFLFTIEGGAFRRLD